MNFYKWVYIDYPRCKTCGKKMEEWFIGQSEFEHTKCSVERISDLLIKNLRSQLDEISNKIKIERNSNIH